jgi:hypothetical protein
MGRKMRRLRFSCRRHLVTGVACLPAGGTRRDRRAAGSHKATGQKQPSIELSLQQGFRFVHACVPPDRGKDSVCFKI